MNTTRNGIGNIEEEVEATGRVLDPAPITEADETPAPELVSEEEVLEEEVAPASDESAQVEVRAGRVFG